MFQGNDRFHEAWLKEAIAAIEKAARKYPHTLSAEHSQIIPLAAVAV
jgi:hypothetical protein